MSFNYELLVNLAPQLFFFFFVIFTFVVFKIHKFLSFSYEKRKKKLDCSMTLVYFYDYRTIINIFLSIYYI